MAQNFIKIDNFVPGDNPAEAWADWRKSFEIFETAVKYHKEDDDTRIALLLSVIGKSSYKDYLTFTFPPLAEGASRTVKEVLDKFDEHYRPYKNVTLATYVFNNISQRADQNLDSFVTELKLQADQCDFGFAYDRNVRDRLIHGLRDNGLRERLLREPDLSLRVAVEICKSSELSKLHSRAMCSSSAVPAQVDAVDRVKKKRSFDPKAKTNSIFQPKQTRQPPKHRTCSRCGSRHQPRQCPAYGKTCNNCGMENHFATVCRQPKRRQVSAIDSTNADVVYIGSLSTASSGDWIQEVAVNNLPVAFKLDTGAQVNVLPVSLLERIQDPPTPRATPVHVCTYTGDSLPVAGECMLRCVLYGKCYLLKFMIVDIDVQPVLGATACTELNLIQRVNRSIDPGVGVNSLHTISDLNNLISEFDDVFEGHGRLPGKYKITLHQDATPIIASARKIPLALEESVRSELLRMENIGVIEKVTKPTDWVNPIVIVPKKDNSIRLCLDPRHLNKYIKRQHYRIPSQDQLLSKLEGSRFFTLLDAKSAFHQIQLDDQSADLCTFITPFGRYRFKVLPFGLSTAPEVFQMAMDKIFEDFPDINPYFDDVILHSTSMKDHYDKLKTVLQIARRSGLKFNKDKMQIAVSRVKYLGHIVSSTGLSPDPVKIEAIAAFPTPSNRQDLMRFLGMSTYLMKFVPQFSQETSTLRNLLKKDTSWVWDSQCDQAFCRVKQLLQTKPVLQFFNKDKPVVLSVDASSYGLGGVLLQSDKPVAYTSATLTDAQSRYSQIEKELLAIVHACEHFHFYVYGRHIEIQTDHKPLLGLIHKSFDQISPRLQRFLLRLQRYTFTLTHVPGKYLTVADALSRAPLPSKPVVSGDLDTRLMVSVIVQASQSKLDQLRQATLDDLELQCVKEYILNGWPRSKQKVKDPAKPYWNLQSELHIKDDMICRGQRIIIPKSCQKDILAKLHQGHRGIVTCKNLARQSLYWPGISVAIENLVSSCTICQLNQKQNCGEPLMDRKLPDRPWQKVAVDFFHFASATYILVIDYFSKYIELQHLHQTIAPSVINALKTCFARFGIPEEVIADNGPPFNSLEFADFCRNWDIFFNPTSPGFPRANGQVERCVQTVKNGLTKALQDKRDVHLVLMEYRNAPMDGLPSPAEVLMGRRIRTLIPTLPTQLVPHYDCRDVQKKLHYRQQRQHRYDVHSKPLSPLSEGQAVLFWYRERWCTGTILQVGPQPRSYIVKAENGQSYRRNRQHIKIFRGSPDASPARPLEHLLTSKGLEKSKPPSLDIQTREATKVPSADLGSSVPVPPIPLTTHAGASEMPVPASMVQPKLPDVQTTRFGRVVKPPERFNITKF